MFKIKFKLLCPTFVIVILFYPDHLDFLSDFKHYSVEPNSCQRPCNVVWHCSVCITNQPTASLKVRYRSWELPPRDRWRQRQRAVTTAGRHKPRHLLGREKRKNPKWSRFRATPCNVLDEELHRACWGSMTMTISSTVCGKEVEPKLVQSF